MGGYTGRGFAWIHTTATYNTVMLTLTIYEIKESLSTSYPLLCGKWALRFMYIHFVRNSISMFIFVR
jgi:hypothetical protein